MVRIGNRGEYLTKGMLHRRGYEHKVNNRGCTKIGVVGWVTDYLMEREQVSHCMYLVEEWRRQGIVYIKVSKKYYILGRKMREEGRVARAPRRWSRCSGKKGGR